MTTFVKLQGDLRNFEDIDKALGKEKYVHSETPRRLRCKLPKTTCPDVDMPCFAFRFDAVIHFAGRKAVGESVKEPMLYYTHNVVGAVNLIEAMRKHNVKNVRSAVFALCKKELHCSQQAWEQHLLLMKQGCSAFNCIHCCLRLILAVQMVFSSSCTVYGEPQKVPLDETHPLKAVSPYGRSKLIIEDMFRDVYASDKSWRIILLRYFNPVGAHPSGPQCHVQQQAESDTSDISA